MYKCLYFHILNKKLKNDEIDLAFTISAGLHSSENIDYRTLFKPPNNYVVVYEDHRLASERITVYFTS